MSRVSSLLRTAPALAWVALIVVSLVPAAASAQQVEWLRRFGAAGYYDDASAVAADASGVYVTGRTRAPLPGTTGADLDAFVRKYGFDGKLVWSRQFKISTADEPFAIAVDESGVYVAGRTEGNNLYGAFVSRLTLGGSVAWSHVFDYRKFTEAWAIAVHETGIYVGGDVLGVDTDAVLAKLDRDGRESWISPRIGTTPDDAVADIAVDDTGVYAVGAIGAAAVRKFGFDGTQLVPIGDGMFQGQAIALDADGIFVSGHVTENFGDYGIRRYDRSGGLAWDKHSPLATGDVAVDDTGLYVVLPNVYGQQPQVAKYTFAGNFVWQGGVGQGVGAPAAALHDGVLYLAGTTFAGAEEQTGAFVARYSPTLPPQLLSLGLIDGAPALATLVHDGEVPGVVVNVRNAATGTAISRVSFPALLHPQELAVLPDRNGNGAPELALLAIHETNGNVVAQVRDARSGVLLSAVGFDRNYVPRGFLVVPGIGAGGKPGLGVLGASSIDQTLRMELKDSVTAAPLGAVPFDFAGENEPFAKVAVVPDVNGNGNPELAVLAIAIPNAGSRIMVKDSGTGDWVTLSYLSSYQCPQDFAVAPDVDGNGVVELATLLQGCWSGSNRVQVDLRDPSTAGQAALLGYGRLANPVALIVLPDFDGNGAPQLGVLALNVAVDKDVLSVKDSATNLWTHSVTFLHAGYRNRGVARLPDVNGNGRPEVAQLQERRSDGALRIMIKDAQTGALVRLLQ